MALRAATVILTLLLPARALAQSAAVMVGGTVEAPEREELAEAARSVLQGQGFTIVDLAAPGASLPQALEEEPLPSQVAGWADELEAQRLVVVFVEAAGDGDEVTLRLSIYDRVERRLVATGHRAERGEQRAWLVEELTGRSTLATRPPAEESSPQQQPRAEQAPAALPTVDDNAPPPPPLPARSNDGRAQLVINSTLLGLALMAGVLFAADVQDFRLFAPILLVGGGGGLATALLIHRRWPVSRGDTAVISAGGWYGAAAGILVAGIAGTLDLRWLMTGSLVGELLGLSAGILAAAFSEISAGDGALIHSSAIWGLFCGGTLTALVWHDDPRASFGMALAGLGVGIGVGALLTRYIEISTGRAAVIDLCGLLGILLGASVGIPIIIEEQSAGQLRAYAGILLGAAAAGLGLGVLLTRRWDEGRGRESRRRRSRGSRVSFAPTPTIVPPSPSVPGSRAALGVQLVGGTW